MGIAGEYVGLNHRKSDYNGEVERILADCFYTCCTQLVIPLSSFAPLRTTLRVLSDKELGRMQISSIQILKQVVCLALEPSLTRQGAKVQPHQLWKVSPGYI